jgi:hypothetical protein
MNSREPEYNDEASVARLLKAAGRGPTASDEARARIYRAVQAEWRNNVAAKPSVARPRPWQIDLQSWLFRGLPVAAALAVAVVVLYVVQAPAPQDGIPLATVSRTVGAVTVTEPGADVASPLTASATIIHAGDTITTASDAATSLALDNGLSLRIDSGSELLLAASDRIEVLSGTVYLDSGVDGGDSAALDISTPFGTVWHRGTQYEVRVGSNNVRIRVREGEIGFRDSGNAASEFVGEAGEQLLFSENMDAPVRSTISRSGPEWQWVEDLASAPTADEYRLLDLLQWVARETGRELSFASPALEGNAGNETLYGVAGLSPAETLDVIASTTATRYELTDGSLLIF